MSQPRTIRADVPGAAYDILVQPGLLRRAGEQLRRLSAARKVGVVTDSNVAPLHGPVLQASLREAGFEPLTVTLQPGEDHKTLASLGAVYDAMLSAGIERSTPLVALGGGIVGDMTGFAAATLLRGVPFVQAPTTLLSMVDASVGGKTGVNHPVGKNLIGAFHQPLAVLIDPAVLATLPARELRGGLAECIKHDIIRDPAGFADLESRIDRAAAVDIEYLAELVAHNVAIKSRVVEADPLEHGERAHLNFGHTFAHAIETLSDYAYSHGEAVALGMVAASRLAVALGMLDAPSADRIVAVIARAQLPVGGMGLDPQQLVGLLCYDKKVKAGKVRFVLPDRIGHVVMRDDVPPAQVLAAIETVRG